MSFPNDTSMYAAEHHNPGAAVLQHNFLHIHQQPSESSSAAGPHRRRHHHQWVPPPAVGEGEGEEEGTATAGVEQVQEGTWQNARYKSEILAHPLYEQLLAAHVACLRIATPVDQLPRIDAQLALSQGVVGKYSVLGAGADNHMLVTDEKELDQFMTHYVLLLCSFKEQLQQHVRVHAMEAVMACWELEQALQSLTDEFIACDEAELPDGVGEQTF